MMQTVIETHGLSKRFGAHRGITDVDLRVEAGEVFGFLGPNGAGKSTTIRCLMGLYRPTSGSVTVLGGHPIRDVVDIHRNVGYIPGELALYPRVTGRMLLDRFSALRGTVDTQFRDELVERLDAELDRPTQTLSKGNRQKLGIIAAFMHRPELLVLDEPTSGLDPLLREEFLGLVEETTADGRTVFLSSHDLDEVQRTVTRLAIIKDGRLVVTDTVEGLRRHAPRTIELRFDHPVDATALAGVPGTEVTGDGSRHLTLTVTGSIAPVLRAVAAMEPTDLRARPADLDELFMGYYRSTETEEMHDAS